MSDYAFQAEAEMWDAIASQPAPAEERYGSLEEYERANESRTAAAAPVPTRCVAHDRYHDCTAEVS